MHAVNRWTIPFTALLLGACASVSPSREKAPADPLAIEFGQPRRQAFVGQGELILTREQSLFDALMHVRPAMMRTRLPNVGGADTAVFVAYLDDQFLGEVGQLKGIRTNEVLEVRFLSKVETLMKFGRSPVGGSVVVRTR
jgi:hypothetical protein